MATLKYDVIINTKGVDGDLKKLQDKFRKTGEGIDGQTSKVARTAAKIRETEEEKSARKVADNKTKLEEKVWQAKVRLAKKYARMQVAAEIKGARETAKAKEILDKKTAANRKQLWAAAGTVGKLGMGVVGAGIGAVSALAGAGVKEELAAGLSERQLANRVAAGGDKRSRSEINNEIAGTTKELSRTYGVSRQEAGGLLAGYQEKGGKLMSAEEAKTYLGMAMSSGMDYKEMGNMAGLVGQQMGKEGLTGQELQDATVKMTQAIIKSGDVGNIDPAEMVTHMGKVIQAVRAQGGGTEQIGDLMAGMQRSGLDAAEATSSMVAFQSQAFTKAKELKDKYGVNVKDKSGNLRNIEDIKVEILKKTKGDQTKLQGLFGETGGKYITAEASDYRKFYSQAKDKKMSDKDAADYAANKLREVFQSEKISVDDTALKANIDNILNDPATQLSASFNAMKQELASGLLPLLPDITNSFKELVPIMTDFAKVISGTIGFLTDFVPSLLTGGKSGRGARKLEETQKLMGEEVSKDINLQGKLAAGVATGADIKFAADEKALYIEQLKQLYSEVGKTAFGTETEAGKKITSEIDTSQAELEFLTTLRDKGVQATTEYGKSVVALDEFNQALTRFTKKLDANQGPYRNY
jgi:hypothetical protein